MADIRHIGILRFSRPLCDKHPELVKLALMGLNIKVVMSDALTEDELYYIEDYRFKPVTAGQIIPEYTVLFGKQPGEHNHTARIEF